MDEPRQIAKPTPFDSLSERQRQSLTLVAKGFTSKEIARELGLSPSTVDNHIRAAIDKLGAKNRMDAARKISAGATFERSSQLSPVAQPNDAIDEFVWWKLPPLGGRPNKLTTSQRLFRVVQIAFLAVITVSAAILTIAGVVHILSQ